MTVAVNGIVEVVARYCPSTSHEINLACTLRNACVGKLVVSTQAVSSIRREMVDGYTERHATRLSRVINTIGTRDSAGTSDEDAKTRVGDGARTSNMNSAAKFGRVIFAREISLNGKKRSYWNRQVKKSIKWYVSLSEFRDRCKLRISNRSACENETGSPANLIHTFAMAYAK